LVVRYERRVGNLLGFACLGCIIILLRRLTKCLQGTVLEKPDELRWR
jgi:hypothetical protein